MIPHDDRDPLLDPLAALPDPALDAEVSARIHRRARAVFVRRARPRSRLGAGLERIYGGALEPALAVAVTVAYLGWAVHQVLELLR